MSALLLHFAMMIIIGVRVKKRQLWARDWAMVGLILPIVPAICLDRMTKKQEEDLQEFRSKTSKAASLAKKINEAHKIGMTHRKKQYQ